MKTISRIGTLAWICALLWALSALPGCNRGGTGIIDKDKIGKLQTGDLLFVAIPADYNADTNSMSSAISAATGEGSLNFIHTAIIEKQGKDVWIIDATIRRGVDRYPLDTFLTDFTLRDGSLPTLMVMRLKDNSLAGSWVENARQHIGRRYDVAFKAGDDANYCTELVEETYLDSAGKRIFHTKPMNFKAPDGTMPPYWEKLFKSIGADIPQGEPGTNPQDMYKDANLITVTSLNE